MDGVDELPQFELEFEFEFEFDWEEEFHIEGLELTDLAFLITEVWTEIDLFDTDLLLDLDFLDIFKRGFWTVFVL